MKRVDWLMCLALAIAPTVPFAQTAAAAAAATERNEAGKIDLVAGTVTVVGADQKQRAPKKGEKLFEGDSIITNANGELHADLLDGGVLAVRPNTAMLITKYQANGDAADASVFGLLKGSFRSITGWIAKTSQTGYKVITPTATMGVRGTDHEPTVIPEGAQEGEPGTYDRVHVGASFIESQSGRVDVAQGRAGFFAAHGRDRPRVLDQVPAFYRPARNDQRLAGRHQRISQTYLQRRVERAKAVQERRNRSEAATRRQQVQQQGEQQRRQAVEKRRQQQATEAAQRRQQLEQRRQEQQKARQTQQQQTQQRDSRVQPGQGQRQEKRQEQRQEKSQEPRQQRPRPQAKESNATPQQR